MLSIYYHVRKIPQVLGHELRRESVQMSLPLHNIRYFVCLNAVGKLAFEIIENDCGCEYAPLLQILLELALVLMVAIATLLFNVSSLYYRHFPLPLTGTQIQ